MANNTEFTMKQAATGSLIRATLLNDKAAMDLSGWAFVKVTVRKDGIPPAIDRAPCVIDPDQTANRGVIRFQFDGTTAAIDDGTYNLEFYGRDSNGRDWFFPTDKDEPYGTVIVEPNLG